MSTAAANTTTLARIIVGRVLAVRCNCVNVQCCVAQEKAPARGHRGFKFPELVTQENERLCRPLHCSMLASKIGFVKRDQRPDSIGATPFGKGPTGPIRERSMNNHGTDATVGKNRADAPRCPLCRHKKKPRAGYALGVDVSRCLILGLFWPGAAGCRGWGAVLGRP
jgi:hypothetical protein